MAGIGKQTDRASVAVPYALRLLLNCRNVLKVLRAVQKTLAAVAVVAREQDGHAHLVLMPVYRLAALAMALRPTMVVVKMVVESGSILGRNTFA